MHFVNKMLQIYIIYNKYIFNLKTNLKVNLNRTKLGGKVLRKLS